VVSVTGTASTDSLKAQRYVFVKKSASYASLTVISIYYNHPPRRPHRCAHSLLTSSTSSKEIQENDNNEKKNNFRSPLQPQCPSSIFISSQQAPSIYQHQRISSQRAIHQPTKTKSSHPSPEQTSSDVSCRFSLLIAARITTTTHIEKEKQFTRKENEGKSKELDKDTISNYTKTRRGARMQHVQTPIPFSQRTKIHHRLRTDAMLFSKTTIIEKQDRSAVERKNQNQGQEQGPPTVPTPPPAIQFPSLCTQSRICKKQKSKTSDFELHRNARTHRIANSSKIRNIKLCFAASLLPALPFPCRVPSV
jgi:hypothetical protein